MPFFRITVLSFLFTMVCYSQSTNDTILAHSYYKKADSLLTQRISDSSIVYFKKAIPLYEKAETWERVIACYNEIAKNYARIADYKSSLASAETALKIHDLRIKTDGVEKADAYDHIATYHRRLHSDYKKALFYHEKAFEIRKNISAKYPAELSKSYLHIGWLRLQMNDPELALRNINKSLDIRIEHYGKEHSQTADVYYYLGNYHLQKWNFDKALAFFEKTLAIKTNALGKEHIQVSNVHRAIGIAHYNKQNTNLALSHFNSELNIKLKVLGEKHPDVGSLYINIGSVYITKGDYEKALNSLEKALAIQNKIFSKNHSNFSIIYYNLSKIYHKTGAYEKALEYNFKTLAIDKKIHGEENVTLATNYNKIGLSYLELKKYDQAEFYFNKSLDLKTKAHTSNHISVADSYNNLGKVYRLRNERKKALTAYTTSLRIKKNKYKKDHVSIANSHTEIGLLYLNDKKIDTALYHFNEAIDIVIDLKGNNHPKAATIYNHIAQAQVINGNHSSAIDYFKKSITSNHKVKTELQEDSYNFNQYANRNQLLISYEGIAKSNLDLFYKTKSPDYLKKSQKFYQTAGVLSDFIRANFNSYKDKIFVSEKVKDINRGAIKALTLMANQKNAESYLKKIFYHSETSKSNVLAEILNTQNANSFSNLPQKLIDLEKNLKVDRSYYQSKINREKDSLKINQYSSKLFYINRKQDSLTEILEQNYPNYYQLKYQNEIVTVSKVQKYLDDNTSLLEFFTADSITYAFTITKNKMSIKELSTQHLQKNIENFRESIISKNTKAYIDEASSLYQQLIAPIEDQLVGNELIIIPDGPLWHVNFDLLLTQKVTTNNPKELPYLLKDYAITYANSATLLFNTFKTSKPIEKRQECLAFSFTDSVTIDQTKTMDLAVLRNAGDDLPGTREEIKAIADIIDGQYFFGSEANEENFKKNASHYNILHLALHGEVDNEQPENSKLFFTKSKDTIEDNFLYSHELFALNIPAELTVLSACNTGTGKIAKGEGIMSLGNAFQYAGTKSLLLTSWEVSDQATPTLMKYFYANLKEGMNKAQSLQKAKLKYLNTANPNRVNPFYWGGFYLIGDTAPITFDTVNYWSWILGIGILVILLFGVFWLKKKRN